MSPVDASEPLTPRQREALEAIAAHVEANGVPPSFRELARMLGASSSNVATKLVEALEAKGYLKRMAGRSRTLVLAEASPAGLPIVGFVPAGYPVDAAELVEDRLESVEELFDSPADFLLRVRGDSMCDAGILDGDLVGIRKVAEARSGQIVVARVDGEVTLKRLRLRGERAVLEPANPDFRPIEVAAEELLIEGLCIGVIRRAAR